MSPEEWLQCADCCLLADLYERQLMAVCCLLEGLNERQLMAELRSSVDKIERLLWRNFLVMEGKIPKFQI